MTVETLFGQAFAESGHDTDATPAGWTLATQMSSSDPVAFVTAIWWRPSVTATGAYDWRIYSGHIGETRTLIASGAFGAYTAGGAWQRLAITPVDVSGLNFMVAMRSTASDPSYSFASGKWPASNGTLSGNGSQSGAFSTSGGTPDNGSTAFYMIDAEVTTGAAVNVDGTLDATSPAATATNNASETIPATAVATAPAATATNAGTGTITATAVATAPAATAVMNAAGGPDLDITVGQPHSAWSIGQPRSAWTFGQPR